ncbi:MAG: hypothetical protein M1816_002575 [Peltula sp. TS41687]|nr:MAG: hypothetical protein M1816_002575 [Peltula sp. TS41687]
MFGDGGDRRGSFPRRSRPPTLPSLAREEGGWRASPEGGGREWSTSTEAERPSVGHPSDVAPAQSSSLPWPEDGRRWPATTKPLPHTEQRAESNPQHTSYTGSDPGPTPSGVMVPDRRGNTSFPGSPQMLRPRRPSDLGGSAHLGHLPPVTHLLVSEPSGSQRPSSYSPRWGTDLCANIARSPRASPSTTVQPREPSVQPTSSLTERPPLRPASFAFPAPPEMRARAPTISDLMTAPVQQRETSVHPSSVPRRSPQEEASRHAEVANLQARGNAGNVGSMKVDINSRSAFLGRTAAEVRRPSVGDDGTSRGGTVGSGIWTGTHYLPKFIGERIVQGEGPCFFYDDGTHCRTVIDGEAVNAHWGVTKAGRPRKRLAEACLTCREKKIKCEPDYPKCVQCEKFGRVCKFKNSPRPPVAGDIPMHDPSRRAVSPAREVEGAGSPETRVDYESSFDTRNAQHFADSEPRRNDGSITDKYRHLSSESEVDPLDTAILGEHPSKRRRRSSPVPSRSLTISRVTDVERKVDRASMPTDISIGSNILEASTRFHWQTDPYEIDPGLVLHLLELFFEHVNSTNLYIFPQVPFMRWLQDCKCKTQDDFMLVHTILMIASSFSNRPDRKSFSRDFGRISRYAMDNRRDTSTIQLVQSRLFFSLHSMASNRSIDAWEVGGAAIRAAIGLELNEERPIKEDELRFGLSLPGFAECKRRTFWAVYLSDDEDIFLRLPCDDKAYEEQTESTAPLFQDCLEDAVQEDKEISSLGGMAHLVRLSSIWGEVITQTTRLSRSSTDGYEGRYRTLYSRTQDRIRHWQSTLPPSLAMTRAIEADLSSRTGPDQPTVLPLTLFLLTATTQLLLHRHVNWKALSAGFIESNLQRCTQDAERLLLQLDNLVSTQGSDQKSKGIRDLFGAAILEYAVGMIWDVLNSSNSSRCTLDRDKIEAISLKVLEDIRAFWHPARTRRKEILDRGEAKSLMIPMDLDAGEAGEERDLCMYLPRT